MITLLTYSSPSALIEIIPSECAVTSDTAFAPLINKSVFFFFNKPPKKGTTLPLSVIFARIAAPSATASSTFTPPKGSFPDISLI